MTVTTTPTPRPRRAPTLLPPSELPGLPLQSGQPVPSGPVTDQVLPFRTDDCPAEAEQLLKQGLVRQVLADVLVAFDVPDSSEVRTRAAALLIPPQQRITAGWVVGFGSAAWLHTGSDPGARPAGELQVIIPPGRRRPKAAGVRGRQVSLAPDEVVFLGSVPVTTPVRTAADVARDLPTDQALIALHRLGELCGVRPHEVLEMLGTMRYSRGAATARQVIKRWTEGS